MPLKDALGLSEQWIDSCVAIVNSLTVPTTNRSRVAAALHQLSIEHYTGVHVLVETGVYSAAFALYRPQFEAYIRGSWYHRCATDNQVNALISGGEPPTPKDQMVALENCGAFDIGSLQMTKANRLEKSLRLYAWWIYPSKGTRRTIRGDRPGLQARTCRVNAYRISNYCAIGLRWVSSCCGE